MKKFGSKCLIMIQNKNGFGSRSLVSLQTLGASYLTGPVSKHWERRTTLFVIRIVCLFYGFPTLCACKICAVVRGGCQLCLLHFLHCFCKQEGEHCCHVPASVFGHLTFGKELILQPFDARQFYHFSEGLKKLCQRSFL